jgi:hypothetical protein
MLCSAMSLGVTRGDMVGSLRSTANHRNPANTENAVPGGVESSGYRYV